MKHFYVVCMALLLVASCGAVFYMACGRAGKNTLVREQVPAGWVRRGTPHEGFVTPRQGLAPELVHVPGESYSVGTDLSAPHSGRASGYIARQESVPKTQFEFGTLMQGFKADKFRGKTLRMSAYVRTENAEHAALWMRVDREDNAMLRFNNMDDAPITGTTDWSQYKIEFDIPQESAKIAFGVLLHGSGKVWVDDFHFDVIEAGKVTGAVSDDEQDPLGPYNLGFEH